MELGLNTGFKSNHVPLNQYSLSFIVPSSQIFTVHSSLWRESAMRADVFVLNNSGWQVADVQLVLCLFACLNEWMRSRLTIPPEWTQVSKNTEEYVCLISFVSEHAAAASSYSVPKLEKEPLSQDSFIHLSENCPSTWIC